jgi:hypothetical protein
VTEDQQYAVMPSALRRAAAGLKGHEEEEVVPVEVHKAFPVSVRLTREQEEERRKDEEAQKQDHDKIFALLNSDDPASLIGQEVLGQGVFIGRYTMPGIGKGGLRVTFNVFAAPEDLPGEKGEPAIFTYREAVRRVAELGNWHGFNGAEYASDRTLDKDLWNENYTGGWVIPPCEILAGLNKDKVQVQPDNLRAYRDEGVLSGSFKTDAGLDVDCPDMYWSCTEHISDTTYMWAFKLSDSPGGGQLRTDKLRLSCRPVRFVPVKD